MPLPVASCWKHGKLPAPCFARYEQCGIRASIELVPFVLSVEQEVAPAGPCEQFSGSCVRNKSL